MNVSGDGGHTPNGIQPIIHSPSRQTQHPQITYQETVNNNTCCYSRTSSSVVMSTHVQESTYIYTHGVRGGRSGRALDNTYIVCTHAR